jgi:hypothetical protein
LGDYSIFLCTDYENVLECVLTHHFVWKGTFVICLKNMKGCVLLIEMAVRVTGAHVFVNLMSALVVVMVVVVVVVVVAAAAALC